MDAKTLMKLSSTPSWSWPEEAGEILLEALTDTGLDREDEQVLEARLLAIELAGEPGVMNDELATALLAIICDPEESAGAQERAAISLGPILEYIDCECIDGRLEPLGLPGEDELPISEAVFRRAQDMLRSVYLDPQAARSVRRSALEASVRAPRDWHRDAVRAAYFSGDERWRTTAVFAMRWIQGFDEQILEALASEDEQTRRMAVLAAGGSEVAEAWPEVSHILQHEREDTQLLLAAIEAAPGVNAAGAAAMLGKLARSADEEIAEAALEAIAEAQALAIGSVGPEGAGELLELVDSSEHEPPDPDPAI